MLLRNCNFNTYTIVSVHVGLLLNTLHLASIHFYSGYTLYTGFTKQNSDVLASSVEKTSCEIMPRIDAIDLFLQMSGSANKKSLLYITYIEFVVIFYLFVSTYMQLFYSKLELTMKLFDFLLILIFPLLTISFRLYHRRRFREMDRYAKTVTIPDEYQSKITFIINYHLIGSNLFILFPALYALIVDSVHAGDYFTFPYADVVPLRTSNVVVYVCKYLFYTLPVYIVHLELCFMNTTFIHYTGVMKVHIKIIVSKVNQALATKDEQKLKNAIICHQDLLK